MKLIDDDTVQHEPAGIGDGLRTDTLPDENIGEGVGGKGDDRFACQVALFNEVRHKTGNILRPDRVAQQNYIIAVQIGKRCHKGRWNRVLLFLADAQAGGNIVSVGFLRHDFDSFTIQILLCLQCDFLCVT